MSKLSIPDAYRTALSKMKRNNKVHEECAVFGVSLKEIGAIHGGAINDGAGAEAAGITYNGLLALQHRGQDGAGIAVVNSQKIVCRKDTGLVSEVFPGTELEKMPGHVAVGHTLYSTNSMTTKENIGPFVTEYLTGRIAVAHNGNITNVSEIRDTLNNYGIRFSTSSDTEVISALIAYYITKANSALFGVIKAADFLQGAFSLVIASSKNKLIAVRDLNGFRPLCIGKNETGYAVSSESCALEVCGFEFERDVLPGEVVVIENGKILHNGVCLKKKIDEHGLCIFEYVYFARPDSIVDGLSVYESRYNMGVILANEHPAEADIVCGVPDSGLVAASGYSAQSNIPLVSGFEKNRYVGRSFIYPTQMQRDSIVRQKLNPLSANVRGKRVVLVDDSIVRGTTCEKIIKILKNAGAKEVHMRVSAPPFINVCHFGTDVDDKEKLIANQMNLNEICKKIGADSLGYISIEGLKKSCGKCVLPLCTACFSH